MALIRPLPQSQTGVTLWNNNNPNSSFSGQNVTLSNSMSNYAKIRVEFRVSTTESSSFYLETTKSASTNFRISPIMQISGDTYTRYMYPNNDTEMHFGGCYKNNTADAGNAYIIPIAIYGIN